MGQPPPPRWTSLIYSPARKRDIAEPFRWSFSAQTCPRIGRESRHRRGARVGHREGAGTSRGHRSPKASLPGWPDPFLVNRPSLTLGGRQSSARKVAIGGGENEAAVELAPGRGCNSEDEYQQGAGHGGSKLRSHENFLEGSGPRDQP